MERCLTTLLLSSVTDWEAKLTHGHEIKLDKSQTILIKTLNVKFVRESPLIFSELLSSPNHFIDTDAHLSPRVLFCVGAKCQVLAVCEKKKISPIRFLLQCKERKSRSINQSCILQLRRKLNIVNLFSVPRIIKAKYAVQPATRDKTQFTFVFRETTWCNFQTKPNEA